MDGVSGREDMPLTGTWSGVPFRGQGSGYEAPKTVKLAKYIKIYIIPIWASRS